MPVPRYLERPTLDPADLDTSIALPYGATAAALAAAIVDLYAYLQALNRASIEHGYDRLEDIMLPAGFSGLMSELLVRAVAREPSTATPGLARNMRPGGRPDLVPRALYENDEAHRGADGVEVKVTTSASSWQGHNPETGWIMVAQIAVDRTTHPVYDRDPTIVQRLLLAQLEEGDWTYSGRSATSRRTPTASINVQGRSKLLQGVIYERGRSHGEHPPPVPAPSVLPIV